MHFAVYAAMLAGQSKVALEVVEKLEATLSGELLRVKSPPMADWLESFLTMRVHVLVRFGRWHDILALDTPKDAELYCVTTAMLRYGKVIALAATGRVDEAERARSLYIDAAKGVPESRTLFNNKSIDILAVASDMLDGELEYRKGNFKTAFEFLRSAMEKEDRFEYDEPWAWMLPVRHAYGALLMEQGHCEEASGVYAADLGINDTLPRQLRHPKNVWALQGLQKCLVQLGRTDEAKAIAPALKFASEIADVKIESSCFCSGLNN